MYNKQNRLAAVAAAFVVSLLQSAAPAWAQSWSPIAPMPAVRHAHMVAAVGNQVYAIGGVTQSCFETVARMDAFDTVTGTWSSKAPMPDPRLQGVAVPVGGKIYVIGGQAFCSLLYGPNVVVYDPATNSWSERASLPAQRRTHAAAAIGTKIYVMGGRSESGLESTLFIYDTLTDTWTTGASMPFPRVDFGAAALGGLIYAVGAPYDFAGDSQVIAYNPTTDTWTPLPGALPDRPFGHQVVVLDDAIYVLGGYGDPPPWQARARMDRYDAATGTWIAMPPMLSSRANFGAAVVGRSIYAMGGLTGTTVLSASEVFDAPPPPSDTTAPQVVASATPVGNPAGWNNTDVNVVLSATDNPGGTGVASVTYSIANGASTSGATVPGATASFGISAEGVNTVTYRAADVAGNSSANQTLAVRIDKIAPAGSLTVSPDVLWPPNNKMVAVQVSLAASDASGPISVAGPVITSNEAPAAAGDWEVNGTTLRLRAARNGGGDGRIYTIAYTLTDVAGNTRELTATVTVPRDVGR